jgi:nucleotide-binding universal stress UspA family protein
MYRTLLVPLDGSPFGEQALPLARSIARAAGAALHLAHVHVISVPMSMDAIPVFDEAQDAQNRTYEGAYLAGLAQRLAADRGLRVTTTVLDGPIADALQNHAVASGADLIVLTTHGRGAFSRFWLGSVADRLVRHAPLPILLVRPHETPPDLTEEPALREILIPLDGSALSEQILPHAIALGTLRQATYTLLQVVEPAIGGFGTELYGATVDEQALVQARAQAQSYLDRVATRLRAEGLRVRTALMLGLPAQVILEYTHTHTVDVVALATHGHSGVRRLLLGSVADKVLRGAEVPVLLKRPRGEMATPVSMADHTAEQAEA